VNGILVALVDQPHIPGEVFNEVAAVSRKLPDKVVIPAFQERRGHPMVIPRELFSAILAAPPASTSREFLAAHLSAQILVPVTDAGIHFDIDTPEDLLLAQQRYQP
jgi:molybdenum cofactor cytidylyltransferase